MTARALLIRGLIAGVVAGVVTFLVAFVVGEPSVDAAIALEGADAAHSASRGTQRTWGLLLGTLAVAVALGGILALVAAATLGRLGRLRPGQSTALVALFGFVAFTLVPFLKYPPLPSAAGGGDTVGDRTALYFGFVLVSVLAAVAATYAALRLRESIGTYGGVLAGLAGYLVVTVVAGQLFADVRAAGDFPADLVWSFRRASLVTLTTMWAVIAVVLTWLVSRLHAAQQVTAG